MTEIKTKFCKKCNKDLPLEMFSKDNNSKDGLQSQCKECNRRYYKENKDQRKKYQRDNWKKNEDRILEYNRNYYRSHPNVYERRKDGMKEYSKQWRKYNTDKTQAYSRKYQQKINELPHTLTNEEWDNTLKEFEYKCAYCGEETDLGKDHFIPVSKDGGLTKDNMLPSCKRCNCSKHDIDFSEWYPNQEFYNKDREIHILNYLNYEEVVN